MYAPIKSILDTLKADAQVLNPDVFTAYGSPDALTVWTEGGEWPVYRAEYGKFVPGDVQRNISEVDFLNPGSVAKFEPIIRKAYEQSSLAGITMDCGTGKSTQLMKRLHAMKMGLRTIVVQPSLAVARQLSQYMANTMECFYARSHDDLPSGRALVYTGPGAALDMILTGSVSINDIIVVDEAHSSTMVHDVLEDLLSRLSIPVLLMTASTSVSVRAPRGVKLEKVDGCSSEVSEALAKNHRHLIVGVNDNMTYGTPSNPMTGVTVDLQVVYDTGLRPEPRIDRGNLVVAERKATTAEVLQMMGRMGRMGKGGVGYYNDHAAVMHVDGLALYDIMGKAIRSGVGLSCAIPMEKAVKVWKANGIVGKPKVRERSAESTSEDSVGSAPLPPYASNSKVALVTSEDGSAGSYEHPDRHGLNSDDSSSYTYRHREKFRRRSSGVDTRKGQLIMESRVKSRTTGDTVALVKPDPTWRPFRVKEEMGVGEITSNTGIVSVVTHVEEAYEAGDIIYPCLFPRADRAQTALHDRNTARMVLANLVIPMYTELELLTVVVLWNDVASASSGPMPSEFVQQFVRYFKSYKKYSENTQV